MDSKTVNIMVESQSEFALRVPVYIENIIFMHGILAMKLKSTLKVISG